MSNKTNSTATQVVVGTPNFGNHPNMSIRIAIGQLEQVQATRQETQDWREVAKKLMMEYCSILAALAQMKTKFLVADGFRQHLNSEMPELMTKLSAELKFQRVRLPEVSLDLTVFPRDFATQLPNGNLLVEFDPKKIKLAGNKRKQIKQSPFGVGGRVLPRCQIVLIAEQIYSETCQPIHSDISPFQNAGLQVGQLPNAVNTEICAGIQVNVPDDHLDRTSGLLEDTTGNLHLIVDPAIYSGWQNPFSPPLYGPEQTIEKYQKVCDELGIRLHVPETDRLAVAASVCFWQAENRKVLMTSGDEAVADIVTDIVGSNNLFLTSMPIRYFPSWSKAGIRCLIGELPNWLLK